MPQAVANAATALKAASTIVDTRMERAAAKRSSPMSICWAVALKPFGLPLSVLVAARTAPMDMSRAATKMASGSIRKVCMVYVCCDRVCCGLWVDDEMKACETSKSRCKEDDSG